MKYATQIIAFVLTVACLSLPTFAADGVQATLDRLANMDFNEQQAWLRHLEEQADKAAQIALSPDDAKRARAEIADLLHRETVTWAVLREAIEKTESLEDRARKRLLEQYRALEKKGATAGSSSSADSIPGENTAGQANSRTRREAETPKPIESVRPQEPKSVPSPILRPMPELAAEPIPSVMEETPKQPVEQDQPNILSKKGVTAGSSNSADSIPRENTAGQASSGTRRSLFDHPVETRVEPPVRSAPLAPAFTPREMPPGAVKINTNELGARIAGCNLAFRALEADLDEAGPWNGKSIEPLLDRLETLSIRRDDLKLYRDLLPEGKRAKIAKLETPKTAMSRLGARIFEVRRAINSPGFEGTEAERRLELARLEMLSHRLAKAAGEKP